MKRLLILFLVLFAFPAYGQDAVNFREIDTQWLGINASTATATTTADRAQTRWLRLVADTAAYYALALSGQDQVLVTNQATAHYLPADTDRIIRVSPGSTVVSITVSGTGTLWVTELTR